eukprot:m.863067 g.863067  ORF g.863067 m.863067 type:complete len:1337 (+) comp23540_c0_seq1:244-4254(+)
MSRYFGSSNVSGNAFLRVSQWKTTTQLRRTSLSLPLRNASPASSQGTRNAIVPEILICERYFSTRPTKKHGKIDKQIVGSNRLQKKNTSASLFSKIGGKKSGLDAQPVKNGSKTIGAMLEWHSKRVQQESSESGKISATIAKKDRERQPESRISKRRMRKKMTENKSALKKTARPANKLHRQPKRTKHNLDWSSEEYKEIVLLMHKCLKNYRTRSEEKLVCAVQEALSDDPRQITGLLVNTIQFANYDIRGFGSMEDNGRKVCRTLVECMPTDKDKIDLLTSTDKYKQTIFHEAVKCGHWKTFDDLAVLCTDLMTKEQFSEFLLSKNKVGQNILHFALGTRIGRPQEQRSTVFQWNELRQRLEKYDALIGPRQWHEVLLQPTPPNAIPPLNCALQGLCDVAPRSTGDVISQRNSKEQKEVLGFLEWVQHRGLSKEQQRSLWGDFRRSDGGEYVTAVQLGVRTRSAPVLAAVSQHFWAAEFDTDAAWKAVTHLHPTSHDSLTSLHYAAAGPPDVFQTYLTLLTSMDVTEGAMKALFLNETATRVFPEDGDRATPAHAGSVARSMDKDVVTQRLVDLHGRIPKLNAVHIAAQARFGDKTFEMILRLCGIDVPPPLSGKPRKWNASFRDRITSWWTRLWKYATPPWLRASRSMLARFDRDEYERLLGVGSESTSVLETILESGNAESLRRWLKAIEDTDLLVPMASAVRGEQGKRLATKLLFSAVQSGSLDCLRIYLSWVASFLDDHAHIDMALNRHAQGTNGMTIMGMAAAIPEMASFLMKYLELIEAKTERTADVWDVYTMSGARPLNAVKTFTDTHTTPLHTLVCASPSLDVFRQYIDRITTLAERRWGADAGVAREHVWDVLTTEDSNGRTPFHYVLLHGSPELYLEYLATALRVCSSKERCLKTLLFEHNATHDDATFKTTRDNHPVRMACLHLGGGAEVNFDVLLSTYEHYFPWLLSDRAKVDVEKSDAAVAAYRATYAGTDVGSLQKDQSDFFGDDVDSTSTLQMDPLVYVCDVPDDITMQAKLKTHQYFVESLTSRPLKRVFQTIVRCQHLSPGALGRFLRLLANTETGKLDPTTVYALCDTGNSDEGSLLNIALHKGDASCVREVLDLHRQLEDSKMRDQCHGARSMVLANNRIPGANILHSAVCGQNPECITLLFEYLDDVAPWLIPKLMLEADELLGVTPLHFALVMAESSMKHHTERAKDSAHESASAVRSLEDGAAQSCILALLLWIQRLDEQDLHRLLTYHNLRGMSMLHKAGVASFYIDELVLEILVDVLYEKSPQALRAGLLEPSTFGVLPGTGTPLDKHFLEALQREQTDRRARPRDAPDAL